MANVVRKRVNETETLNIIPLHVLTVGNLLCGHWKEALRFSVVYKI